MEPVAVVIPYYQRDSGILRRALHSVYAQRGAGAISIFLVDDSSPAPPAPEIDSLTRPDGVEVRVFRRENGGPGAARNTALDQISGRFRYVAFLDSDDEWTPSHLYNACRALDAGADVYFADLMQLGAEVSAFSRAGRLVPTNHPEIPDLLGIRGFSGDMFDQILSGNVIGTPTVVYRYHKFSDVRFRPEFRTAGEDYLFWMDLASAGARFAFSEQIEAFCGRGVNVYSGVSWGTTEHLWRIYHEAQYRLRSQEHYRLTDAQKQMIEHKRHELRVEFSKGMLHLLRRLKPIPMTLLLRQFFSEPRTAIDLLKQATRLNG